MNQYYYLQIKRVSWTLYMGKQVWHMYQINAQLFLLLFIGVQLNTALGERRVHAMLMVCSLDLPAKAALLNMKQFNGASSCSVCDAPGQTFRGSHLHRFWPFNQEGVFRTDTAVRENALNAAVQGKAVRSNIYVTTKCQLCQEGFNKMTHSSPW